MSRTKGADKKRPCLRCDRMIQTSPEVRLCKYCKVPESEYQSALRGMDYGIEMKGSKK